MAAVALLTTCVGLSCSISDSNVTHEESFSLSLLDSLLTEVRAGRHELHGFSQWYHMRSESARKKLLIAIDDSINPEIVEMQEYMNKTEGNKEHMTECYNRAFRRFKQAAEDKLPSVISCAKIFIDFTSRTMRNITERMLEMTKLEKRIKSIEPSCANRDDRVDCLDSKSDDIEIPVHHVDTVRRQLFDKESDDFDKQYQYASNCQFKFMFSLLNHTETIQDEAYACMRDN